MSVWHGLQNFKLDVRAHPLHPPGQLRISTSNQKTAHDVPLTAFGLSTLALPFSTTDATLPTFHPLPPHAPPTSSTIPPLLSSPSRTPPLFPHPSPPHHTGFTPLLTELTSSAAHSPALTSVSTSSPLSQNHAYSPLTLATKTPLPPNCPLAGTTPFCTPLLTVPLNSHPLPRWPTGSSHLPLRPPHPHHRQLLRVWLPRHSCPLSAGDVTIPPPTHTLPSTNPLPLCQHPPPLPCAHASPALTAGSGHWQTMSN
jgi:hypothetical protein